MKNNLFYITPFYLPNKGGVEFYIERLSLYFCNKFSKIRIITYSPLTSNIEAPKYEKKKNIYIHRFNWPFKNLFTIIENKNFFLVILYLFPGLFINTIHKMFKYKSDIIHGHGLTSLLIMYILSFFFKRKYILSSHAIYNLKERQLLSFILKILLSRIDHIIAVGELSKKELINCNVPENKISIFKNWVDENYYKPIKKKGKKLIFLFVGRLIEKKGVKIFCTLSDNFPKINFYIVGEGDLENYVENKIKHQKTKNLKLFKSISKPKLLKLYQKSDLLVAPVLYEEGNASIFLEALACGLPILTDRRGCIPENLNSEIAYFVKSDEKKIIIFLNKFIKMDFKRIKQKKCRDYFMKKFSSKNLNYLEKIYNKKLYK